MAKGGDLGFICYISTPERGAVPVNELTEEERAEWQSRMRERLSADLSGYFTQHPEEYVALEKKNTPPGRAPGDVP